MTKNIQHRKLIIVLGAGRTGTSLLMQVLKKLNMTVSEEMTPPSEQNIDGGFEDTELFEIHSRMLKILGSNQLIPLPDNWLNNKELEEPVRELERILAERIDGASTIFGFKDPRTILFLPLWKQILNRMKIEPVYICSVRDPASTVSSLKAQYNFRESVSELFWLHKHCEMFFQIAANGYIVHYEDWFTSGKEMAQELLAYTGLSVYFDGKSVEDVLDGVIKSKYNRSIYEDRKIQNGYVTKLYAVLRECRGGGFDHEPIMQQVKECRQVMHSFRGWYQVAFDMGNINKEKIELSSENSKRLRRRLRRSNEENQTLNKKLEKCIILQNDNLKMVQVLQERLSYFKGQASTFKASSDEFQQKITRLNASFMYRCLVLVARAIKKPGRNTYLLPFRLIKIFYSYITKRDLN